MPLGGSRLYPPAQRASRSSTPAAVSALENHPTCKRPFPVIAYEVNLTPRGRKSPPSESSTPIHGLADQATVVATHSTSDTVAAMLNRRRRSSSNARRIIYYRSGDE